MTIYHIKMVEVDEGSNGMFPFFNDKARLSNGDYALAVHEDDFCWCERNIPVNSL